jgi:uncharacterized membrane protein
MIVLKVLAVWFLVSLVVSPIIGKFLAFNDREVKR